MLSARSTVRPRTQWIHVLQVTAFATNFLATSLLLVDQAVADTPTALHGFAAVTLKNAYITPRGLVVHTSGMEIQPLGGLVFPLQSSAGVWGDLATDQHDKYVGAWNEFDYFAGVSAKIAQKFEIGATYVVFTSPPHNCHPEQNLEFKLAYDESAVASRWSIHPYLKLFYAITGDSTIVLGKKGGTFDVEIGVAPTRSVQSSPGRSITVSFPTFLTIGGPGFFGDGRHLGVFSTGPSASFPLNAISARMGSWRLDALVTYFHLLDDNLVMASRLLGNSGRRDEWVGQLRVGMGF